MRKQLCILHANCQGDAIRSLLEASPRFNKYFEIQQYCNYQHEEIAQENLKTCGLLLHQYLAPSWGTLSTEQVLNSLPSSGQAICLPNFFFKGYWPFWTNESRAIEFADSLLENLFARKLPPEVILHLYLKADQGLLGDVEALVAESLQKEKEKEKRTPIKYLHVIEEYWQREQLFLTINHPGKRLLFYTAESILKILDLGELPKEARENFIHPQADFWLPIHPAIARRFNLAFVQPKQKYNCFGNELTFEEYIGCYLACRQNGIKDLTVALRNLSKRY